MSRIFRLTSREFVSLVILFLVSLPAVTARIYASDEVQYFSYLRSLYFDQDVSFENEYRYFHDHGIAQSAGFHETFLERKTNVGRRVNYGTIGSAILWLPFYAAADVWTRITGRAPADGFSQPYIRAVAYGSALYGFIAVLLSVRAARILVGGRAALLGALAVWIGTPLLFYMYVAPPFAHATSAFAVALFVNVWLHVRRTWTPGGAFALGLCAALMGLVREQDTFLALGPALDFVASRVAALRQGGGPHAGGVARQSLLSAVCGVAGVALGFVPQLLAYTALNGYPGPASDVSRKMYWTSPHALGVLASPQHGFFLWTPLAVLALAGLVVMVLDRTSADRRRIGVCLLIMVASQIYVAGSVASWTVAGAFGQRRFVCLTIVLTVGLAMLLRALGLDRSPAPEPASGSAVRRPDARAVAVCALVAVMVWWNVALIAMFATRLMNRQQLEPARNAYHAFVTLPLSLPSLAYRYLFDRASFYDRPMAAPQ